MTLDVLTGRIRVVSPGAPEWVGAYLVHVTVRGHLVHDRNAAFSALLKESVVCLDDPLLRSWPNRHRGDLRVEVPAVQVNSYDRRLNLVNSIRHTSSFLNLPTQMCGY